MYVMSPSPPPPLATLPHTHTHTHTHTHAHTAPLVMHSQSMNGLRRSFLCRVKRAAPSQHSSVNGTPDTQVKAF